MTLRTEATAQRPDRRDRSAFLPEDKAYVGRVHVDRGEHAMLIFGTLDIHIFVTIHDAHDDVRE